MLRTILASILAAAIGLSHGAASGPAGAAIFGADDRKSVPRRLASSAAGIGVLRAQGRGSGNECNAVCVAPQVIATSAHCLYFPARNGSRPNLSAISFRNAFGASAVAGTASGQAEWNIIAGSTYKSMLKGWTVSNDWALVRLAKPVCQGATLELAVKNKWGDLFDDVLNDQVFVISHNRYGRLLRQQYASPCDGDQFTLAQALRWILIDIGSNNPEHLVPHRCDFKRGASGSPLLLEQAGKAVIVGINAAESDSKSLKPRVGNEIARQISANFAVSAAAFKDQIELLTAPVLPLSANDTKELQSRLIALGHYVGKADGRYGRGTRQAVLDFEQDHGLTATGRPALKLLNAAAAAVAAPPFARRQLVAIFSESQRPPGEYVAVHAETGSIGRAAPSEAVSTATAAKLALAMCASRAGASCRLFAIGETIVAAERKPD